MKKIIAALAILAILATVPAFAEDIMLDTKVESVTTKMDKNGNEYTRIIIKEAKSLNGVPYTPEAVVMCFDSDLVTVAKKLQPGDNLKAIASTEEYKGKINFRLLAFVQETKKQ